MSSYSPNLRIVFMSFTFINNILLSDPMMLNCQFMLKVIFALPVPAILYPSLNTETGICIHPVGPIA